MHVVQPLRKRLKKSWIATCRQGGRGSCVFLVEERRFRAFMPVDTPAALAPPCGTLWRASVGTASHTSWWEPSGHLVHKSKHDRDVIKWRQITWMYGYNSPQEQLLSSQLSGQLLLHHLLFKQDTINLWGAVLEFSWSYMQKRKKKKFDWALRVTWFTVCHHHPEFILCCCQQVVRLHVTERDLTSQVKGWCHRRDWWKCVSLTHYNSHTSFNKNQITLREQITWLLWRWLCSLYLSNSEFRKFREKLIKW